MDGAPVGDVNLGDTKRRILARMKRSDTVTTPELARHLELTEVAVRQHLDALGSYGLVERVGQRPSGPGRPAVRWRLTDTAGGLFPDRHGELAVTLLDSIAAAVGPEGLERVLRERTDEQVRSYRAALPRPGEAPLAERVAALAERRTAEGYLAEVHTENGDGASGAFLLVENHCPICDAATSCAGLCRSELDLFRETLGTDVDVQRVQHVLDGDRRCAYRIRPR